MKLIVGIGNPGVEYDRTRHNVGFEVLDRLARRLSPGETARSRFNGSTIEFMDGDEKILFLKPLTYVNRTGEAVAEAIRFYKMAPAEDLLVIAGHLGQAQHLARLGVADSGRVDHLLGDLVRPDLPHLVEGPQELRAALGGGVRRGSPGTSPGRAARRSRTWCRRANGRG